MPVIPKEQLKELILNKLKDFTFITLAEDKEFCQAAFGKDRISSGSLTDVCRLLEKYEPYKGKKVTTKLAVHHFNKLNKRTLDTSDFKRYRPNENKEIKLLTVLRIMFKKSGIKVPDGRTEKELREFLELYLGDEYDAIFHECKLEAIEAHKARYEKWQ